jgi:osmotically-inducible protein OsmY
MGSEAESFGEALFAPFRDAWLAARTRFAILAEVGVDAAAVNVEAYYSNVIIAGDVGSRDLSAAVERTARNVPGVFGVSNRVRVRGAECLRAGTTDAEIRTALTARLRAARMLRGAIIVVDSVYDGVVRLTGVAPRRGESEAAFALALDVPGVRRVINDVILQPEPTIAANAA